MEYFKNLYIHPPTLSGTNIAALLIFGIIFQSNDDTFFDYLFVILGLLLLAVYVASLILTYKVEQMDKKPEEVDKIETEGAFSVVRHPNTTGIFCMNVAMLFFFRTLWVFIPLILFTILWYFQTLYEERVLLQKYPDEYKEYKEKTGMFLPKDFYITKRKKE